MVFGFMLACLSVPLLFAGFPMAAIVLFSVGCVSAFGDAFFTLFNALIRQPR